MIFPVVPTGEGIETGERPSRQRFAVAFPQAQAILRKGRQMSKINTLILGAAGRDFHTSTPCSGTTRRTT